MRSHHLMREALADGGPDGRALGSKELRTAVGNRWVQDPDFYYDLLAPQSAHLDVWTTEYQHVLTGRRRGAGSGSPAPDLRPILNGLDDGEREIYLEEYRRRLNA